MYTPKIKACYGQVEALPALDQAQITAESTTLVIFRPSPQAREEIEMFFDHLQYKNRVLFLTGDSTTYERVLERSAYLRAIGLIVAELQRGGVRENDPQMIDAKTLETREQASFYFACREAFRQLLYPVKSGLNDLALEPQYSGNSFNGEQAIVDALKDAYKYEPEAGPNNAEFVQRIITRLWSGAKEVPWNEVKTRAATDPSWIWHHPRALDDVRAEMISRDQWRDIGNGFVQRGPFPPPRPAVQVQLLSRDDKTGEATLRVRPLHGDTVYMEEGNGRSLGPREKLESYDVKTRAPRLTFTAADAATGVDGDTVPWTNTISLRHRLFGTPDARMCELQALPAGTIRYTTDGSSPSSSGALYREPFRVPRETTIILAQASADGVVSDTIRVDVPKGGGDEGDKTWRIDPAKPATWRKGRKLDSTSDVFTFLDRAIRRAATLSGVQVIAAKDGRWAELQFDKGTFLGSEVVRDQATALRDLIGGANVTLEIDGLAFTEGQQLLDLSNDLRETPTRHEVVQS